MPSSGLSARTVGFRLPSVPFGRKWRRRFGTGKVGPRDSPSPGRGRAADTFRHQAIRRGMRSHESLARCQPGGLPKPSRRRLLLSRSRNQRTQDPRWRAGATLVLSGVPHHVLADCLAARTLGTLDAVEAAPGVQEAARQARPGRHISSRWAEQTHPAYANRLRRACATTTAATEITVQPRSTAR